MSANETMQAVVSPSPEMEVIMRTHFVKCHPTVGSDKRSVSFFQKQ